MNSTRHPYAGSDYAASFTGSHAVVDVPEWSTYVLDRPIDGSHAHDAAGLYPMTSIDPAADLAGGLERLRARGAISVVFVADPLWRPDDVRLHDSFSVCRPFKTHHLVVPERELSYSYNTRREIRRGRAACQIRLTPLLGVIDEWCAMNEVLAARHGIGGIASFSREAFLAMAQTPGLFAAVAEADGDAVAISVWIAYGELLYLHLAASLPRGYELAANYALVGAVIEQHRDRTIDLGGCAGLADDPGDGLWFFKQRFANATATALLCGRVLDRDAYAALSPDGGAEQAYFPAYRAPASARSAR